MISDPFDPTIEMTPNPQPPPAYIPNRIEGLSTTGLMGTQPALTIGGLIAAVAFVVNILVQYFGVQLSPEIIAFGDQYGVMLASVAVPILTAALTYFKVFSPHSAAEIKTGAR